MLASDISPFNLTKNSTKSMYHAGVLIRGAPEVVMVVGNPWQDHYKSLIGPRPTRSRGESAPPLRV
jgi:hypothetical protein